MRLAAAPPSLVVDSGSTRYIRPVSAIYPGEFEDCTTAR